MSSAKAYSPFVGAVNTALLELRKLNPAGIFPSKGHDDPDAMLSGVLVILMQEIAVIVRLIVMQYCCNSQGCIIVHQDA